MTERDPQAGAPPEDTSAVSAVNAMTTAAHESLFSHGVYVDVTYLGQDFLNNNPDAFLVLAQAAPALEARSIQRVSLSFHESKLVTGVLHINEADFTAEKLRQLFARFGISLEIPVEAPAQAPAHREEVVQETSIRERRDGTRFGLKNILQRFMPADSSDQSSQAPSQPIEVRRTIARIIAEELTGGPCEALPANEEATSFNIVDAQGVYTGYSIVIGRKPPYMVTVFFMYLNGTGKWHKETRFTLPYEKVRQQYIAGTLKL